MQPENRVTMPTVRRGSPVRPTTSTDPWIGQVINSRYQLSGWLAAGPSGSLYGAQDGEKGTDVTIKLLPRAAELDRDFVRRLRDALSATRAVARIRPHVAVVHDCDRIPDGRAFMVMEALSGRSLGDLLRQEGALPLPRALRLAFRIAEGLWPAHAQRLIHGALDAEHVLVGTGDTVKVTGFEVARIRLTARRPPRRDPPSEAEASAAPPDRARALSEQADIQALGLLVVDMLTGTVRPGTEGADALPERMLLPEVPAEVRELVTDVLSTSPPPRARAMRSLAAALWGELDRAEERPGSRHARARRAVSPPARRLMIGLAALVVVTVGAWVTRHQWMTLPALAPLIQAVRSAQSPRAPAPAVTAPAPVSGPADVVVKPPVPLPRSRTEAGPAEAAPPERSPRPTTPEPTPRVTVAPRPPATPESAPASGPPRREPRSDRDAPDPSAIIDWLLNEAPRQER
jgi:serine/threonine protein kinase